MVTNVASFNEIICQILHLCDVIHTEIFFHSSSSYLIMGILILTRSKLSGSFSYLLLLLTSILNCRCEGRGLSDEYLTGPWSQEEICTHKCPARSVHHLVTKVSAVLDRACSAVENRSTFSSMLLRQHCRLVSIPVFEGGVCCLKTGRGRRKVHILLICDLFSPALQFLSKTALILEPRVVHT